MDHLCCYANRPFAFIARYISWRPLSHAFIVGSVLAAVGCSVGTQYGIKFLVDALSGADARSHVWQAFAILVALIAADNLLWRVAGFIANSTFVGVTGDLRRDLFRHLTGHAPSYFANRLPGMLTSRVTATSNAIYTVENMFVWNVMPPCVATVAAIALLAVVSPPMAMAMTLAAVLVLWGMFHLAAAGRALHHDFADKAAAVDGEMVDIINNMPVVKAFGGLGREHRRFDATVGREMEARNRSLLYLEKVRMGHAAITILLTIGLLCWAVNLWQEGAITNGDVILVCTLGLSVLHATRDLAVALVDMTQHLARLSEALATLLVSHELRDHPSAAPLVRHSARIEFRNVSFKYPDGHTIFENFNLTFEPGQSIGLVGRSGSGKSTLFALMQRFYDVQAGSILIDNQDITRVTQESLREAMTVVPQDVSLFHRSILENIRYGRPEASDQEVLEAAIAAKCDFIESLPDGMLTVVGDRGVKLSGGQRQRLAIARGFLKNAPILLLDEATSALDGDSEEAIRDVLKRLMRGKTVIAIAHRLSTVRHFDRVVVLQSGKVVQDGPPDRLLRIEGPYRRMVMQEMNRLSAKAA